MAAETARAIRGGLEAPRYEPERPGSKPLWMGYGASIYTLSGVQYDFSGPHYHPGFEVGIVMKGSEQVTFNDCTLSCQVGDLWFANAWETHQCLAHHPDDEHLIAVFRFDYLGEELVGEVPWVTLFTLDHVQMLAASDDKLRRKVLDIAHVMRDEDWHRAPRWELVVRFELLRLFTEIERKCFLAGAPINEALPRAAKLAQLVPALSLLRSLPLERVSLGEAARACGLSPSHFHRLFGDVFGISYAKLCLQNRLSLASSMIVNTSKSIAAIAAETGFASSSHLHRHFRRYSGCTPGEYRRRKLSALAATVGAGRPR